MSLKYFPVLQKISFKLHNDLVRNPSVTVQLNDLDTKFLSELPALEIFHSIHNQLSPQNDMDIDNHLTMKNNFSFYNFIFYKLCSNKLHNKGNALSLLHSNQIISEKHWTIWNSSWSIRT